MEQDVERNGFLCDIKCFKILCKQVVCGKSNLALCTVAGCCYLANI